VYLSTHLIIPSEEFFSEELLQQTKEREVIRHKMDTIWWMGKAYPAKPLKELHDRSGHCHGKYNSLCEETRVLLAAGFLQMLQWQYVSLLPNDPEAEGGECPASQNSFKTFLFIRSSFVAS
jgi:hypothetical protein